MIPGRALTVIIRISRELRPLKLGILASEYAAKLPTNKHKAVVKTVITIVFR